VGAVSLFPPPPASQDLRDWADMELYAATVLLEAEGESEEGKVAVAWVIRTRMDQKKWTAREIALAPDQFSCWNPSYQVQRKARLMAPDPGRWASCWRAAVAAYYRLIPDPTQGADHYINPALARQTRSDHSLPTWYDSDKVTLRVGRHEFLRLG